jgi:hypothetical protein
MRFRAMRLLKPDLNLRIYSKIIEKFYAIEKL